MEIKIGMKFSKLGKAGHVYEVSDIVKLYSTQRGKFYDTLYLAKGLNTLCKDQHEVSKSTVIRGLIKE